MTPDDAKSWIIHALPYLSAIGLIAGSVVAISGLILRIKLLKSEKDKLEVERQLLLWVHDTDLEMDFDRRIRDLELEADQRFGAYEQADPTEIEASIERLKNLVSDIDRTQKKAKLIGEALASRDDEVALRVRRYSQERVIMFGDEINRLLSIIRFLESNLDTRSAMPD